MNKTLMSLAFVVAAALAFAEPYPHARVTVDPGTEKGPVKLMNAVNGGPIVAPVKGDQKFGNFVDWKALRIPFGRTHDCINCVSGGPHTCDISAIFPNFDADENDPKNYDFVFTDYYLDSMVRAGTRPFFRLGQTIEHGPKKYGVLPPKDFAKWARICEHVIRHYNEGWAWGVDKAYTTENIVWSNQFNIVYWEIWNEPDLDVSDDPKKLPKGPRCWGGTVTNFFNFYETAAKHLKAKFPNVKIGGPALCGNWDFGERFLRYCRDRRVPLDFFSWHVYSREPDALAGLCRHWRETMDKYGFQKSESILNEWNYVKGWTENWVYSRETESGRYNQKSAAYVAGAMIDCQKAPLDLLMYYDARNCGMNGLFEPLTAFPMKGYYPFYAWSKLLALGTEVGCSVREWDAASARAATGVNVDGQDKSFRGGIRAVAAKAKDGRKAVFVVRYSDDNNVTDTAKVFVKCPGLDVRQARCHLTDKVRSYTEVPLNAAGPDEAFIMMQPNSFAYIEMPAQKFSADIVIYGSSPAAISAAIQARRMGKKAIVVSPETRIGGLTTGGLGMTDIGNKKAFGGIALDFYKAVARYYAKDENWTRQKRSEYGSGHEQSDQKSVDSMWTFEPSAALKILEGWEKAYGLVIHRGKLLNRGKDGVKVDEVEVEGRGRQRKIVSFVTLDGTEYLGKMFVDATYEGDLMAAAGVSYHVGREANSLYGEQLNGIDRAQAKHHQFEKGVSAYVIPGDPKSGLLPYVEKETPDPDGTGDRRVQAYCLRMCLTDLPENRIPFKKPANYDERNYELLIRNFDAALKAHPELVGKVGDWQALPWINSKMPNRKTDTNNRLAFSTDFIGQNWKWPDASYAERRQILKAHLDYQQGLMWTLANHPRIPEFVRKEVSRWGTCKDEFLDGLGDGWQNQLYVREARRMVGEYVMTENNCRHTAVAPKAIAMAAYQMDSHNVRRYVDKDGFVRNEGDVEVGCPGPYPIGYGAIIPKRAECGNLYVPVCMSASHMAFGSIRMEPVFFALGQAAGTAAAIAIEKGVAVQDVPYAPLEKRLRADGQVLEFNP